MNDIFTFTLITSRERYLRFSIEENHPLTHDHENRDAPLAQSSRTALTLSSGRCQQCQSMKPSATAAATATSSSSATMSRALPWRNLGFASPVVVSVCVCVCVCVCARVRVYVFALYPFMGRKYKSARACEY